MKSKNQNTEIKEKLDELMSPPNNITDKQILYTKVSDAGPYPRPTVRRVAAELRNELLNKIKILQSQTPQATTPSV